MEAHIIVCTIQVRADMPLGIDTMSLMSSDALNDGLTYVIIRKHR